MHWSVSSTLVIFMLLTTKVVNGSLWRPVGNLARFVQKFTFNITNDGRISIFWRLCNRPQSWRFEFLSLRRPLRFGKLHNLDFAQFNSNNIVESSMLELWSILDCNLFINYNFVNLWRSRSLSKLKLPCNTNSFKEIPSSSLGTSMMSIYQIILSDSRFIQSLKFCVEVP